MFYALMDRFDAWSQTTHIFEIMAFLCSMGLCYAWGRARGEEERKRDESLLRAIAFGVPAYNDVCNLPEHAGYDDMSHEEKVHAFQKILR